MQMGNLRLFCALAETGSFTRAADLNYITQSAITQMLHALERDAGQPLATRRPFKLNEAGHYHYQYSREILRLYDRMQQQLKSAADAATGTIELAACHSIGLHQLPPVLAQFQRTHPRVEIRVRYGFIDRMHEQAEQDVAARAKLLSFRKVRKPDLRKQQALIHLAQKAGVNPSNQ